MWSEDPYDQDLLAFRVERNPNVKSNKRYHPTHFKECNVEHHSKYFEEQNSKRLQEFAFTKGLVSIGSHATESLQMASKRWRIVTRERGFEFNLWEVVENPTSHFREKGWIVSSHRHLVLRFALVQLSVDTCPVHVLQERAGMKIKMRFGGWDEKEKK